MCNKIGCLVSHLLFFSEKFTVCLAAVSLVSCMIFTLIVMLMLGIGLGYNYCFVDYQSRARYKYVPPHYVTVRPAQYQDTYSRPPIHLTRPPATTTKESFGRYKPFPVYPPHLHGMVKGRKMMSQLRDVPQNNSNNQKFLLEKVRSTVPEEGKNFTYMETPSTVLVFKKPNEMSTEVPKSLLKYYKFWAVPLNATFEPNYANQPPTNASLPILPPMYLQLPPSGVTTNDTVTSTPLEYNIMRQAVVPFKKGGNEKEAAQNLLIDPGAYAAYGPQPNKVISINGLDLMALLSQLRAENRNYSLQIMTS